MNVQQRRESSVAELRQRIAAMQSPEPVVTTVPTLPQLRHVLDGELRSGQVYTVLGGTSLMSAGLAGASQAGDWVAFLGFDDLNAEALVAAGIVLERTAVVPRLDPRWSTTAATLAEVCSVIAVRVPEGARIPDAEAARLAARLRERGCTMLIDRAWTGSFGTLEVTGREWVGLECAGGMLTQQYVRVRARVRNSRGREAVLQLDNSSSMPIEWQQAVSA